MSDSDQEDPWGLRHVPANDKKKKRWRAIMRGMTRKMCKQKYASTCRMKCYKKGIPTRRPRTAKAQAWHDAVRAELDAQVGKRSLRDALKAASLKRPKPADNAAAPVAAPAVRGLRRSARNRR